MGPRCQECGKFVSIGRGATTEISVSQDMIDKGRPAKIYLCDQHWGKIEVFKTFPWYAGHKIV